MASISRLLWSVILLSFVLGMKPVNADIPGLEEECAQLLRSTMLEDTEMGARGEEELEVLAMRRPLRDLIDTDPTKNLVVKNPFMIMNAAQRVSVLVRSGGSEKIRLPGLPQEIVVYDVVSKGINGKRIIGQEASIESIFDNVDAQAMGDRSAASVPLQVGSHGSGKSETIQVLRESFQIATATKDSPYALWTFEWVGLKNIPLAVEANPRIQDTNGTLKAAQDDSPVLLLPKELRQKVIAMGNASVLKMTEGRQDAAPYEELNPQDDEIRRAVLMHYRNLKGSDLTSNEIVAALSKHTQLRRVIWDSTSGALPVIDAQGDDVDVSGIFLAANPVMRVTHGPANVFSWEPSKILKGHGNVVFLDEVLRNPKELLRFFLRIFQERKVSINGSPDFPLDTVFLTATNTSSLKEVLADLNMHALVDRFLIVEMPWTTSPTQISQILLHNYATRLKMQKLPGLDGDDSDPGPLEVADMSQVYPRAAQASNSGPDYRYKLVLPVGDREVKFSPHAIRLMSYIIAATRMNTDVAQAKEVMPSSKVVGSTVFRDPITRIRFEEGKLPDITNGEIEDLRRLSKLLDEGSEGIASRDGGRWLSRVVSEAQRPENRNTVSPDLVFKTFLEMMTNKKIKTHDNKTRLKWHDLAMRVATGLIIPYIESDVTLAMAADQASIKAAYYDMFDEMTALYRDPRTLTYRSKATNEEKPIDQERLAIVRQIFQSSQGRPLDPAQIAMYHQEFRNTKNGDEVTHDGLMSAIASYYAKLTTRLVSVTDLAKFAQTGEGDTEVRSQYSTVLKNMAKLGYDEVSAIAALRFKGRIDSLVAQTQQDRQ